MSKKDIVFCKGGGCTAKLGPGVLSRVLERIPKKYDENLLIGFESSDDASVYKLTDDICIGKIYIDEDLPADRKKATLIHELTHCYIDNYITHCDKQYTEEDVADIVANSYDIIHDIVEQYERNNGVKIEQRIDSIVLKGADSFLINGKPILKGE